MQFLKKILHQNRILLCISGMVLTLIILVCCNTDAPSSATNTSTSYTPQIAITTLDTVVAQQASVMMDLKQVDSVCKITEAGSYVLSGALDGRIEIDAQDQLVHLILSNADIRSASGPALQVLSAGKVIISLQEGTTNAFTDNPFYSNDSTADACIYSECDLTINGAGALNIVGYYQDGVHTKDVLKILGGDVFVQAKQDGLQGNDGIVVTCDSLQVQSERHGLYTSKSGKTAKGNMEIYNGNHSVVAGGYAFSCAADLYIDECQMYGKGVLGTYKVAGNAHIAEVAGE